MPRPIQAESGVTVANNIVTSISPAAGISAPTDFPPGLANNCVYGNSPNYYGLADPGDINGNISPDPTDSEFEMFADPQNYNYHLVPRSRCVDGGSDSAIKQIGADKDYESKQRIVAGAVDIGAFEYHGQVRPSTPTVTDDGVQTTNHSSLHAIWTVLEGTPVQECKYLIGKSPDCLKEGHSSDIVVDWTSVQKDMAVTSVGLSLQDDTTYYFFVKIKGDNDIWSLPGMSDGIKVVYSSGEEVGLFTFDPPPGEYSRRCMAVTVTCATPGVTISYSFETDGSNSRIYDPSSVILVLPTATLHVTATKNGYVSNSATAVYTWKEPIQPPYQDQYNCYVEDDPPIDAPTINGFGVDEIALGQDTNQPKVMKLAWQTGRPTTCQLSRDGVSLSDPLDTGCFTDGFNWTFGQEYTYRLQVLAGHDTTLDYMKLPHYSSDIQKPVIYYRQHWLDGTPVTITVVPMQVSASENQTVDSRLNMHRVVRTPLDWDFGSSVYRGGLFVGAMSTDPNGDRDSSGVGRSLVKFPLAQPPINTRIWAASVNAYYTGSRNSSTTHVGCQPLSDDLWTAEGLKWTSSANSAVDPKAYCPSVVDVSTPSGQAPAPHWCSWKRMCEPIVSSMYGDGTLSAAFTATNEPPYPLSVTFEYAQAAGWAYFAKTQYDANLGPRILYAYGNAPCFITFIKMDAESVKGGNTITGTAYLNSPAPPGGLTGALEVYETYSATWYALPLDDIQVGAGEMSGRFRIATGVLPTNEMPRLIIVRAEQSGGRPIETQFTITQDSAQ